VSVTLEESAPKVLFETVEGSTMVLLEVAVEFETSPIHAAGGVGTSLKNHPRIYILNSYGTLQLTKKSVLQR
jgi:hypothetical protein